MGIKAYLTSAGVSVQDRDESSAQPTPNTNEPITQFDPSLALQKIDAEINETDQELDAVLKTLKSRRKRLSSTDNKFHGFSVEDVTVSKNNLKSVTSPELKAVDAAGATFGLSNLDFMQISSSEEGHSLLEVIFSAPIVRDVDKLTSVCKKITEADQDDRGSQSPDSYGSARENDPELVNSVSKSFKPNKAYSTRKRSSLNNSLRKPA